MSFLDWLFSRRPEGLVMKSEPWGILHIIVLLSCIAIIVGLALLLRKRSEKAKYIAIFTIAMLILAFELARRIINFSRGDLHLADGSLNWDLVVYRLIPRPWCAISCWMIIASVFVKKKFLYNFASMTALINAIIFFAYPDAGFKNHIAFEEFYSIGTHCLLLIGSISLITLGHTDFRYNRGKEKAWYELICYGGVFFYAFLEIIFQIESDPLYFMPGNGVIDVISMPYPLYVVVYVIFVFGIWSNAFYLIPILVNKLKAKFAK